MLAFDPGEQRIGVAVGETVTGTARALVTLRARSGQPNWDEVARLLDRWQPEALVVGVPRHDDGTASASTARAEQLARRLHGRFGLPVRTVDERLSSHEARQRLSRSEARRDPGAVDREAAAIILESYFLETAPSETGGTGGGTETRTDG